MRGRFRRRDDVGHRRRPASRGAFQFGQVLVVVVIVIVVIAVLIALLD